MWKVFNMIGKRKQMRQNVTTARQILASAYLKVICSVFSVRLDHIFFKVTKKGLV